VEARGPEPTALTFSPDGQLLAVVSGPRGRVMLFDTGSWRLLRSIEAYPEPNPPMRYVSVTTVAFSPDSSLIAVGTFGGGVWPDPKPRDAPTQGPVVSFPADPLRIFRIGDGSKVASVSVFPGGFLHDNRLAWLPNGRALMFLDAVGDIRVWRGADNTSSSIVGNVHQADSLKVSRDGHQLAVSDPDGVRLFDLSAISE
jgi:WD40 repeat protein